MATNLKTTCREQETTNTNEETMRPDSITTIRPRTPTDLPKTASLLAKVHARDSYPVQGVQRAEAFLSSPSTLSAWVAVRPSGEVIGHAALSSPSLSDPAVALWKTQDRSEPIAVLERLFVDPAARGEGLAGRLMRVAVAESGRRGLRAVLFALVKDQAAMRLYVREGWEEFGRSMYEYESGDGMRTSMEAVCFVAPLGS